MKKTFWLFLLILALFLRPILSQATEMIIDAPNDIVVTSGEVVIVAGEVLDAGTADKVSLADDATISEGESTIVVPVIKEPSSEDISTEDTSSEEAISDPTDVSEDLNNSLDSDNPGNTPLPSTLVLLGSGILALSGLAWRRNNKR